jgi:hypothetical protein
MRHLRWSILYVYLFIATAVIGCTSFTYTPSNIEVFDEIKVKVERVHLPTKCRPLYNNGTDEWIECMGVGRK